MLNLECDASPLNSGQAVYQKHPPTPTPSIAMYLNGFTDSDFDHMGNIIRNCGPRTERVWWEQRPREYCHQLNEGTRDSHSWHTGRVHSLTHCTRTSADWLGCFFEQDLKPAQEPFQVWSWGLAKDTYYNHFIRKRRAGIQPPRCYRRCFENLRVLTLPWWLNMRRGSNLYPGSKTPGVRQVGPEQDCNIISR